MLSQISNVAQYAIFVCESCRDEDQTKNCGDHCAQEWAGELPPLWSGLDIWPTCRCCGGNAVLVAPLVREVVEVAEV